MVEQKHTAIQTWWNRNILQYRHGGTETYNTDMVEQKYTIQTWWNRNIQYRHGGTETYNTDMVEKKHTAIQTWWNRNILQYRHGGTETYCNTHGGTGTWWNRNNTDMVEQHTDGGAETYCNTNMEQKHTWKHTAIQTWGTETYCNTDMVEQKHTSGEQNHTIQTVEQRHGGTTIHRLQYNRWNRTHIRIYTYGGKDIWRKRV